MNCGTCQHYVPRPDVDPKLGQCQRFPPTPFQEPRVGLDGKPKIIMVSYFPAMMIEQRCGEWEPRPVSANDAN